MAIIAVFAYGVGVGHYRWPPYEQLKHLYVIMSASHVSDTNRSYMGEEELLQYAFTEPAIDGEKLLPAISTLSGIYRANQSIFTDVKNFNTAYKKLILLSMNSLSFDGGKTKIMQVRFALYGKEYNAYAYWLRNIDCGQGKTAALIIPGSGNNQSHAIYTRDPKNYHEGIIDALEKSAVDVFVFIKPNEDIIAFHDGKKKLNNNFIVNYQLNRGSSYSACYIVQSLAITKYLKSCYGKTIIAGVSQGGSAALLNALQSEPDIAIVASGYSMINGKAEWSGDLNQIIIPGSYARWTDITKLTSKISKTRTHYLFTWGKQETGLYKIEAEEQRSCKKLTDLPNVRCTIHNGGHIFPVEEIRAFLIEEQGQK
ncbi:MAG: hypothetical protein NTV58_16400 [Deltaproteobacteria bacterium]|nr:hypothetical protein [Deltaproteobacteria bacterium]